MRTRCYTILVGLLLQWISVQNLTAQNADSIWTLQKCLQYSLQQNIKIQKTFLVNETNQITIEQFKASRYPSVNASVNQNFSVSKSLTSNSNSYGSYNSSNNTNYAVSTSIRLYNGNKINNSIKQSEMVLQASQYDAETTKETTSLSILDAYLQILYSEEEVKNSQRQIESTLEQLQLAQERYKLGVLAKSDYLQVQSELANEKLSLANAESALDMNRLALMQLMELPVADNFSIVRPEYGNSINQNLKPKADSIFRIALGIKPQMKSAELNRQSALVGINIAKAGYLPSLSLNGGLSTGYSNLNGLAYNEQMKNSIVPSIGLTLSIPISQNKEVYAKVAQAKVESQSADLAMTDTKNSLRKSIEQACVDVRSAEKKFDASLDAYNAGLETYNVASEKFRQGLLNSVDYLIQKNTLIKAESTLLQAKYNLIFSYKVLDFYTGIPLSL
jgi:outer membrane protein